jgi:ribosomal protein S12 methylthiotransferase
MKTKNRGSARQARTLGLVHLGCPKNQVDSEEMLAVLAQDGWTLVGDPDDADVLVVNTCAFIDAAKEESLSAIRDAVRRKKRGRCQKVLVAGCLAQRYAGRLAEEMPDVDAIVGVGHTQELPEYLRATFRGERPVVSTPPPPEWQEIGARLMTTPPWTTYLRIGEGCDHTCSFCAIPSFRGGWRSRPAEKLLDEVRMLVDLGLKEAVLVGQDTTLYGRETRWEWNLARLVRELGKIEGLRWQRIMYAHPGRVDRSIVELFGEVPNLAAYIDLPFQHGDDRMLKRMRRAGSTAQYLRLVEELRERCPHIAIRSTFLLGFPGETEEEFENCLKFLEAARPDHAGAFVYSHEEGTPAFEMDSDVPRQVAEERRAALMETQRRISRERLRELEGREIEVLVEAQAGPGRMTGRSERDAPEVDGLVELSGSGIRPGEIVRAKVVETGDHDLKAVAAGCV